jgi:CRP/FNR family transcriptional regulator
MDKMQLIAAVPYVKGLDQAIAQLVCDGSNELHLEPDEVLFTSGEPALGLYVVSEGLIKVTRISPEGREQVLTLARPGHTLNDVPVFDGGKCPASAIAVERSTVCLIPKELMLELVRTRPEVAERTLQVFAARLRGLVSLVADLTHLDVPTRVARSLVTYAEHSGSKSLTVNQTDISIIVGTTREGVARALKRLEDEGAVSRQRGTIEVTDEAALRRIAGM